MTEADLPAVAAIAAAVHPGHPESPAVFAERLALWPGGCRMLEAGGTAAGYLLAHPWRAGLPPPLDSLLGVLPPAPEVFLLHDIALLPAARGTGAGAEGVAEAARAAGALRLALVAIPGTGAFWRGQGFVERTAPGLEKYGEGAVYMERG